MNHPQHNPNDPYQRFAVACPECRKVIHVASPGYSGVAFFCPMCGHDWEEREEEEED
jgi:predicted RNA-binding Zn-ribbon protein involved in translation (DUF1610 family)